MQHKFPEFLAMHFDESGKFLPDSDPQEFAEYVNELPNDAIEIATNEEPYKSLIIYGKQLFPKMVGNGGHFAMHVTSLFVSIMRADGIVLRAPTIDWMECVNHNDFDPIAKEGRAILLETAYDPDKTSYLVGGAVHMMCSMAFMLEAIGGGTREQAVLIVQAAACLYAGECELKAEG